jgi:excisionase family DNA binding protein
MVLQKSKGEHKADVLLQVIKRGRASARQAAVLLGVDKQTAVDRIERGKIRAVRFNTGRYYVSVAELFRCGLVLPPLAKALQDRINQLVAEDPLKDEVQ